LKKDWVLTEIIFAAATGTLADELVLKGGQALRHILVIRQPPIRLPEVPEGRTRYGFKVRPIAYRALLTREGSVELEVSFRDDLVLDPDRVPFVSPFRSPFPVLVMALDEMVSEKLRALYQRGNARDLFDLWFILAGQSTPIDPDRVKTLLPHKFHERHVRGGWVRSKLYTRIEANAESQQRILNRRSCRAELLRGAFRRADARPAVPNRPNSIGRGLRCPFVIRRG
jgi:predicted nucleotidyltransferase component of viral defense system